MRTFGAELRGLLLDKNMTGYRLAQEAGVPRSSISDILNDKKAPTDDILRKIAGPIGKSFDELKALADASKLGEEGLSRIRTFVPPIHQQTEAEARLTMTKSRQRELLQIPFAGLVGCGRKLDLEPIDTIDLPLEVARRGDYAVKAEGDSMNKLIADGDILIIRSQRTAKEGQVVVANIHHDGSTCKRFRRFGKIAMLMPESYNPEHQPEPLTEDISIIGVVTYVHRPGFALE